MTVCNAGFTVSVQALQTLLKMVQGENSSEAVFLLLG